MNQTATITIENEQSQAATIGQSVRQEYLLSPLLFSIYAERMMKEALEEADEEIKIGGNIIKDIRFADDQAMIAHTEEGLQMLMDKLSTTAATFNMKINVKKTKVMTISNNKDDAMNITINGQQVEQVTAFKYLGSIISSDGRCREEIRTHIAMAKKAFMRTKQLLTKGLHLQTKKNIVKSIIWSVVLYGLETWTLLEKEVKNIEAFVMWVWRHMERISWKDRVTNDERCK